MSTYDSNDVSSQNAFHCLRSHLRDLKRKNYALKELSLYMSAIWKVTWSAAVMAFLSIPILMIFRARAEGLISVYWKHKFHEEQSLKLWAYTIHSLIARMFFECCFVECWDRSFAEVFERKRGSYSRHREVRAGDGKQDRMGALSSAIDA